MSPQLHWSSVSNVSPSIRTEASTPGVTSCRIARTLRSGWCGGHARGEGALGAVAVDRLDDAGPPGARLDRVEHAEADAVAQEARAGLALHGELDAPVGTPADSTLPGVLHGPALVACAEANPERGGLGLDLEALELGRDRDPVLGAEREVDGAQHLALAEPDPAQRPAVEDEAQRSRAQRNRELRCFGYRILGAGAGHPSPPHQPPRTYQDERPLSTVATEAGNREAAFVVCSGCGAPRLQPFRTRPMRPAGRATGRPDPVPLDMEALTRMTRPVRTAFLAGLCLGAGALAGAADTPPPVLDRELFFGNPEISGGPPLA